MVGRELDGAGVFYGDCCDEFPCPDCRAKAKGEPAREYVRRITGNLEPCSKSCATCRELGPAACPSAKPAIPEPVEREHEGCPNECDLCGESIDAMLGIESAHPEQVVLDPFDRTGVADRYAAPTPLAAAIATCPCLLIEPCSDMCSCRRPFMSGGCIRCATYGSLEQQTTAARFIANAIAAYPRAVAASASPSPELAAAIAEWRGLDAIDQEWVTARILATYNTSVREFSPDEKRIVEAARNLLRLAGGKP